jgi:hypothetical protein
MFILLIIDVQLKPKLAVVMLCLCWHQRGICISLNTIEFYTLILMFSSDYFFVVQITHQIYGFTYELSRREWWHCIIFSCPCGGGMVFDFFILRGGWALPLGSVSTGY